MDDKEEFHETFCRLLGIRLLTEITRNPSRFESDLLRELKEICGSFYVKSFEKMFNDANEREMSNVTVITGGNNWNICGKLLPGHSLLLPSLNEKEHNWPPVIESEILAKNQKYQQKYPKRKLFWSPMLSSIEFEYNLSTGFNVMIRGNMIHFNVLKFIADAGVIDFEVLGKKYGPNTNLIMKSLLKSGLIKKDGNDCEINQEYSNDPIIDLYTMTLNDLMFVTNGPSNCGSNCGNSTSNRSNASTPLYFQNSNNNSVPVISPIDKSILLQCSITRILKQLRSLNLQDLFTRISMLPKLLTRFSPTLEDLMEALKQLHEKEFVQMVFGDGVDEMVELSEDDLKKIDNCKYSDNLFIKYMA